MRFDRKFPQLSDGARRFPGKSHFPRENRGKPFGDDLLGKRIFKIFLTTSIR